MASVENADIVIGPTPFSGDDIGVNGENLKCDELIKILSNSNKILFAGAISINLRTNLKENDVIFFDLMDQKNVSILNAIPTAEGAIKTAIDTALTNLRIRNNEDGGYLEIDPTTYMSFKNNLVELSTNNPEMIRRGVVGMYDDFEVTRTNAIHDDGSYHWAFAHSGNAIAFVGQINKVEAMRLESTFGDGVRGLDTYGAKIIAQDELEAIKIPV